MMLLFGILPIMINAQTIHWLTFIDTTDKNVGNLDKTGRNVLYGHFIDVVNAALTEKGYKSEIHDYYDTALSPQACKSAVERLTAAPEDIVVFYYIGHGTHAAAEDNPYPQMLLGSSDESKFIPLKWVHDELKAKNPRLLATIGMCCNVVQGARAKKQPTFGVNYGSPQLTDSEKKAIQQMFLGNKGDILVSSASVGQSSIGCPTPFGDMDLFTAVLVSVFEDTASEGHIDWKPLMNEVSYAVNTLTGGNQTPFYSENLTTVDIPSNQGSKLPQVSPASAVNTASNVSSASSSQVPGGSDWDKSKNILATYFDYIINPENSVEKRKIVSDKLIELFIPDAVVKIMGQDGNVVVDKENIGNFIGRISTSRMILKIVPESMVEKSGKISELKVKEIIKKTKI